MNELIKWGIIGVIGIVAAQRIFKPPLPTSQTTYSLFNLGLGSGVG